MDELLCPDCGHHLHRPNPGPCGWHECKCGHPEPRPATHDPNTHLLEWRDGCPLTREELGRAIYLSLQPRDPRSWVNLPEGVKDHHRRRADTALAVLGVDRATP